MDCKFYAGRGGVEFAIRVKEAGSGARDHETRGPKVEHPGRMRLERGLTVKRVFRPRYFLTGKGGNATDEG